MRFTGTVTIYNRNEVDFKEQLIPKLLSGVHTEQTVGAESSSEGDRNSGSLFVLIPFKPHKNGFLPPHEYAAAEDKTGVWTLSPGDIITIGDTGAAENYAELAARTEAYRITEVKTFDFGGLPHWEVTAK